MKRSVGRTIVVLAALALMAMALMGQTAPVQRCTVATGSLSCTITGVVGYASVALQVSGTFTGTLNVTGTVDGVNWVAVAVLAPNAAAARATSITAPGVYWANVAGLSKLKVAASSITGSAPIVARPAAQAVPFGSVPAQ
jgi:hypothetical protein